MAEALQFQRVSKSFGSIEIFNNMDFSLETGESVAILGPSGAGKSTFLHMAGLMERPTSGTILINNKNMGAMEDLERAHERLKTIGFLFQFHHLLPDFNVLENVLIPARLAGDNLSVAEKEGKNLLQRLGLGERLMHKPHELSGGEQQRTALARALIRHPKILLCDEPTGNLDSHTAKTVAEIIFAEIQREGIATIIVTHNQALANQSRTVYYLSDGKFEKHRRR